MNQLLLGASIPFLVGAIFYASNRGRATLKLLIITPCCMAVGSLWAIAPDIPRIIGMTSLYHQLATDPRCDLFFWHYTIDKHEVDSPIYALVFTLILLALLLVALRELTLEEGTP